MSFLRSGIKLTPASLQMTDGFVLLEWTLPQPPCTIPVVKSKVLWQKRRKLKGSTDGMGRKEKLNEWRKKLEKQSEKVYYLRYV